MFTCARIAHCGCILSRDMRAKKGGENMGRSEMLDDVHVQEIFYTHIGSIEDAGSGMIRIVRCVERHGLLVPVLSTVSPAISVLKLSKDANDFARRILREHIGADH
jgi:hypothetical protein